MSLTHAFPLLQDADPVDHNVVACFGSDATLRNWVIRHVAGEGDVTEYDGLQAEWSDLRDDLSTGSLFDLGGKRTVVLRAADKFVSGYRSEFEKYLAKPASTSRLIVEFDALAANTRIYKKLVKDHLLVACSGSTDSKLGVTAAKRRKFLTGYVAARHQTKLAATAADALIEMMGDEIGMLDTEIAKLALYLDPGETIGEDLVREVVAGWQGKTVWQINEAIARGNAAEALLQLDKLMSGGQRPIALLPQIAWSLRRLGMATALIQYRERSGRGWKFAELLPAAGIHRPGDVKTATEQLKGLGRERASQLLGWLLDADLRLKGTHSQEGLDRLLLEQLVIKLAKGNK